MTWSAVTWVSGGLVGYGLVGIAAGRVLRGGSRRMPLPDAANSATRLRPRHLTVSVVRDAGDACPTTGLRLPK